MWRPATIQQGNSNLTRRLITNLAELRDLTDLLARAERKRKMFKIKTPTTYTIATATAEIDEILAKAAAAFVPADRVVDLLESRIAAIARRQAAAYSSAPAFVSGNL